MDEVYPMIPVASKTLWLLGGFSVLITVVLAALIVGLAMTTYAAGHTRVRVDTAGLTIEGDPVFGRSVSWSDLEHGRATVVPIAGEAPHRPRVRTFGTGMPGYGAGWFRLASGEKALVFMTGGARALHVPTRSGWSLLVTVADPDALAERVRRGQGGS